MKTKKMNPQAAQSKQWLLDALLQLMNEKKYHEITIKELTNRSGLDRKTFYRHFKSKDEILSLPIREACDKYITMLNELPELTAHGITKAYFSVCLQYVEFFKVLDEQGLLTLYLMKLNEYLPNLNDMFFNNHTYRQKSGYELTYEAGGFWNVTRQWISSGAQESPEEMAKIIGAIITPLK